MKIQLTSFVIYYLAHPPLLIWTQTNYVINTELDAEQMAKDVLIPLRVALPIREINKFASGISVVK